MKLPSLKLVTAPSLMALPHQCEWMHSGAFQTWPFDPISETQNSAFQLTWSYRRSSALFPSSPWPSVAMRFSSCAQIHHLAFSKTYVHAEIIHVSPKSRWQVTKYSMPLPGTPTYLNGAYIQLHYSPSQTPRKVNSNPLTCCLTCTSVLSHSLSLPPLPPLSVPTLVTVSTWTNWGWEIMWLISLAGTYFEPGLCGSYEHSLLSLITVIFCQVSVHAELQTPHPTP